MKSANKSDNKGNTFTGLVMAAFEIKDQAVISIDPMMQYGNCGTIAVSGSHFDWFDRGNKIDFIEAN